MSCVVSPDELIDAIEVLLRPLDIFQLVVYRGIDGDADTHCYFLHQLTHCFAQSRGVDGVAVSPDDVHTQRFTRVYNVAPLIHRKRDEDFLWLHEVPHYV